ncbi:hypothetical protein [Baekduia sp.]|uniref:hypothetical protein n=1 Tax=Baekduia sp. TaxID=2600305 RepID=UPI002E04175F|nr:hypothetical protein [Baekduia sp.]
MTAHLHRPPQHTLGSALLAAVATGVSALALSACARSEDRSPEAYCRAFYSKAAPIRQSYMDADANMKADPLTGILKLLQAPGDLESIFDSMVDHAPDEIKSDTVQVRDSFKKLADTEGEALSNPLLAMGKGLINSMTSAGAFQRVDTYLTAHCPVDSKLAQDIIHKKD